MRTKDFEEGVDDADPIHHTLCKPQILLSLFLCTARQKQKEKDAYVLKEPPWQTRQQEMAMTGDGKEKKTEEDWMCTRNGKQWLK